MSQPSHVWWQRGVIYQIYPRSFKDTTRDGVGDLRGITEKLGYLEWLGVDAVWISPVFPSPMRDFGYDVTDYRGIDPLFGTLGDFDKLMNEAHRRNLRVILDFVPNHSSDEHPWFIEARGAKDSSKRDWYIWHDAKADGSAPNNWRSVNDIETPGSAWAWDAGTKQFYLASFSPYQPDLNWRNPEVRAAMMDALTFWLERGVDGFRIDMLDFLAKDPELRDELPQALEAEDYFAAAQYQLGRPETHDYIREMRGVIHSYPGRVMIGEVSYFLSPQQLRAFYGEGEGLDLPFHFGLMFLPMEAGVLRAKVDAYDAALGENWPNYNLANHDMPRLSRYGNASRLAAMLLLTLRGTPFLYYGDELGMANVEVPPEKRQDPFIIYEIGTTRDGVRTPMQWSAEKHTGFSDVDPWLPIAQDYERVNVEVEQQDRTSMLWLYKRLLKLRQNIPALNVGDYQALDDVPGNCFAYLREIEGDRVFVVLNFSAEEETVSLPGQASWRVILSTELDKEGDFDRIVTLRPYEGVILRTLAETS